MLRCFSAVVYCLLLVCWSQETSANHLLIKATASEILIDQQLEQNNEQDRYVISGFVVDAESTESLIGATVHAPDIGIGTTTNRYGFFSLSVPADSVRLVVSHVGYLSRTLNQTLTEDLRLNIELNPEATRLGEVEVIAVGESSVESVQMSQIKLQVGTIRALPVLAGETDIFGSWANLVKTQFSFHSGGEVQASEMEVNGGCKSFIISESAGAYFDCFYSAVDAFGRAIADLENNCIDDSPQVVFNGFGGFLDRLQAAAHGPGKPSFPALAGPGGMYIMP